MGEVVYKWKWVCAGPSIHVYYNVESEDSPDAAKLQSDSIEEDAYPKRTRTLIQSI